MIEIKINPNEYLQEELNFWKNQFNKLNNILLEDNISKETYFRVLSHVDEAEYNIYILTSELKKRKFINIYFSRND
jgi:hypothetical protein